MPSRQAALSRPRQEQLHHGQEPLTLDSLDALLSVSQVETASSVHGQSWIMMAVRPVSGAPPSRSPRRRTRTFPLFCRATTPRSSCCGLAAASALCGPCCSFGLSDVVDQGLSRRSVQPFSIFPRRLRAPVPTVRPPTNQAFLACRCLDQPSRIRLRQSSPSPFFVFIAGPGRP